MTTVVEGKKGEDIAVLYLQKKGYQIIDRNFRLRNGEIDIIAIEKGKPPVLVFIEVKTRSSEKFGLPIESITYYKLKALINAAQVYKISHRGLPDQMRIDAISVQLQNGKYEIEHIKNISG